jgi:hypothetical protein
MPVVEREKVHAGSASEIRTSSEEERLYLYRHAGIEERDERVPLWLTLVVGGVLPWRVYDTIQFWSPG